MSEKSNSTAKIVGRIVAFPFRLTFKVGEVALNTVLNLSANVNEEYRDEYQKMRRGERSPKDIEGIVRDKNERIEHRVAAGMILKDIDEAKNNND